MSEDILSILAKNIKKFRQTHNISQEELAEKCNLHRTYIGAIERSERNITLKSLEAIAKGMNVSITELLQ